MYFIRTKSPTDAGRVVELFHILTLYPKTVTFSTNSVLWVFVDTYPVQVQECRYLLQSHKLLSSITKGALRGKIIRNSSQVSVKPYSSQLKEKIGSCK